MSISHEKYNGGAAATTSSRSLTKDSPRVLSCYNSSPIIITLPDPATIRQNQTGGPWFHIGRHSTGSVTIHRSDGSSLGTVSSNSFALINLDGTDFYIFRQRAIGSGRATTHSSRDAVTNLPTSQIFQNQNCFLGSPCDLAEFSGNVPLDGEDGRDLCNIPMIQDIVAWAQNASREPIRAADVVMPSVVVAQFEQGAFALDAGHTHSGVTLPDEFYEAFYNDGKPMALVYDGVTSGTSRHPLHIRWFHDSGIPFSSWIHGDGTSDLTVTRHVWKKIVQYTVPDVGTFELEVRFVAEHCLDGDEPGVDPVADPGGRMHRTKGAWGTIFSLFVFASQLDPDWVDGSSYTPPGSVGAINFSKQDPVVSGIAYGQPNSDSTMRFFHPLMVACAHLPTSYHGGFTSLYVPLVERQYGKRWQGPYDLPMQNFEYNYRRKGQSPFTSPAACSDLEAETTLSPFTTVAFGWSDGGFTYGATYTFGGDFEDGSHPTEFLVWENASGNGGTYLQPTKAGWNEDCGTLDLEGGSSGSITLCIEDQWGLDDGEGNREWPSHEYDECQGHPNEPMEDVGGGHRCFNNGNLTGTSTIKNCCIKTQFAIASAFDQCTTPCVKYGKQQGTSCEIVDSNCVETSWAWRQPLLELEDYNYFATEGGDVAQGRPISWARWLPDVDQIYFHMVHTAVLPDIVQKRGTTGRADLKVTAVGGGSSAPGAILSYEPPASGSYDLREGDVTVEVKINGGTGVTHAFGGRLTLSGSDATGLNAEVTPTGGSNATVRVVKWVSGTRTVLKSLNITNFTTGQIWKIQLWGCQAVVSCLSLSVELTAYLVQSTGDNGVPFIGGDLNADFGNYWTVTDGNQPRHMQEISGSLDKLTVGVSVPWTQHEMHIIGGCDRVIDPDCGNCCAPARCSCASCHDVANYDVAASFDGTSEDRDITAGNCVNAEPGIPPADGIYGTAGDNPTWWGAPFPDCTCYGDWCDGEDWYCGSCPLPFISISLKIPYRCPSGEQLAADEPKMCRGIDFWHYSRLACF